MTQPEIWELIYADVQAIRTALPNYATRADLECLQGQVTKIDTDLYRGNGNPSLKQQVRELRADLDDYRTSCNRTHAQIDEERQASANRVTQKREGRESFFREKIVAPLVVGISSGITVGLIVHFLTH